MSYTLSYDVVNSVPVIVGTAAGANGGLNISIAIDYTAQANLIVTAVQNIAANVNSIRVATQNLDANVNSINANLATITLVGTTNTPLQANGFITRSKYEDYNNLLFLRYIIDPTTGFTNFPDPLNPEQQAALNSIQSWITAANTYVPPTDAT